MSYLTLFISLTLMLAIGLYMFGQPGPYNTYNTTLAIGNANPTTTMINPFDMILAFFYGIVTGLMSTPAGWGVLVFAAVATIGGLMSSNPIFQYIAKAAMMGMFLQLFMLPIYLNYSVISNMLPPVYAGMFMLFLNILLVLSALEFAGGGGV